MYGWMLKFVFLQLAAFVSVLGNVSFIQYPRGTVYYPPLGFPGKAFVCSTDASTDITWVSDRQGTLDATLFNITQVSPTTSSMYLTAELVRSSNMIAATFLFDKIHCQARTNETSPQFEIKPGAAPVVTIPPSNATVNENDTAMFNCTFANIQPTPLSVRWIFTNDRGNITTLPEKNRVSGAVVSVLEISSVERADNGTYRCVVQNEFDTVSSQPGYLIVPYCDGLVTQQTECALGTKFTPSNIFVENETNVTFNVIACSNPPVAEIRLSRSSDGLFYSSSNSNLNRPLGTAMMFPNHVQYTFTADRNWNGSLSSSARGLADCGTLIVPVIVLEPLGSINAIVSRVCPGASLLIQWTVSGNGGSDIKYYTLRWGRNASNVCTWNDMMTLRVSDDDSLTQQGGSYPLTGLKNGVEYCIEITATNIIGSTEPYVFTNATFAVPDKPSVTDPELSVAETRLQIHWTVGRSTGAPEILHYTVIWSKNDAFTSENMTKPLPVSAHGSLMQHMGNWTLMGLTKGTMYYIKVKATNCVGSNISMIQPFLTRCDPGQPAQPSVNPSDHTSHLMFKVPSFCDCCPITGYIVRDSDNNQLNSSHVVANGNVKITITGLKNGTEYTVQVSAITIQSWKSPFSESVTFNTTKDSADEGESGVSTTTTVIIGISVTLGGVMLLVITIIIVIVKKKKPPDEAPPETPKKPYAQSKTNVSITVAWTAEDSSGIRYKVQYRKSGSKTWDIVRRFNLKDAAAVQLVEGLMALTEYEFRVKARNDFGKSDYSEAAKLTTLSNDDKDNCDTSPAPFYMTATQQKKDDGRLMAKHMESTNPAASKTRTSKAGQGPTYIQPEFLREEDRPPARFPQRPVVYSTVDANATQKLYQETKTSKGQTQKTKEGVTYVQPQFLKEEDRPPARFPQRPVVYSQLDAKATQKAREDAELKKLLNKESSVEMGDMPPVNRSKPSSESSSEHDQDGRQQTTL